MRAKSKILLFATVILLSMVHVGMPQQTLIKQVSTVKYLASQSDFDAAHDYSFSDSERYDGNDVRDFGADGLIVSTERGHKTYSSRHYRNSLRIAFNTNLKKLSGFGASSYFMHWVGKSLNRHCHSEYSINLLYETSGTIASVNHLFTLGSVRR